MGLIDRLLGRNSKTPPTAPATPPAPVIHPAARTFTVKRPDGSVETQTVEPSNSTFDDWVAEMEAKRTPEVHAPGVKKVVLDEDSIVVLDLRSVPSTRMRIVGSSFWVTDTGRAAHGGTEYLLKREPRSKVDPNAVAVYGKGRKVGYVSSVKAASIAPILDGLSFDAFRVGGTSVLGGSIRLWVDVPSVPALRAFVKAGGGA
ncbi:HIRAN domain-containing protein [Cryobacterium sp. TMT2-14]|uniref:HIRAN domain-containing protein n=1 Tax=Cryobacterium sp. TMT2-14 TaxID=1259245 RepID=UPI00106D6E72|nr:HIRAN domain-containing protein [Cryobacterium sp. TMT2-14]TFC34998.1 hypothetical protein E3O28_11420 [Cryobacterium sp. TMT2-14]